MAALQFTDQMGRQIELPNTPQRIVSLVPSQTELLFDLGLGDRVVGLTKYCVHPAEEVKRKTKIGGTKRFDLEQIRNLQPDLIIGNKEENYLEGINALEQDFPVWMSDIFTLEDALDMIDKLGELLEVKQATGQLIIDIRTAYNSSTSGHGNLKSAAYFIWRKPWMPAASKTFIDDMLPRASFSNVFGDLERYPEVSLEQLGEAKPEYVLLSSEPYPFKQRHVEEIQEVCPDSRVLLVDGEMFSWYGSRLLKAAAYLKQLQQEIAAVGNQ